MAGTNKQQPTRPVRLSVQANLLETKGAEQVPKAVAYAFSSGGHLLAQQALDHNGAATLTFPAAGEAQSVRVMIGPEVEKEDTLLSDLQRFGAVEHHLRVDPGNLTPSVKISIFQDQWICWLFRFCTVRGTVLKRVVSGGVSMDLPVCNAIVEVYEVDPIDIIVARLPDDIIEKIRDVIIKPPPPPPPPPFDVFSRPFPPLPPGPGPDPAPGFSRLDLASGANIESRATMLSQAEALQGADAISNGSALPDISSASGLGEVQFLAKTTSMEQFRQVLIGHPTIIRPLLCYFLPLVTIDLVATAITDECGHFRTRFLIGCNNPDTPDLYFKVKQQIVTPFLPATIYAPTPVHCYTYWDYVCGTEVTLYTRNPWAITCAPCPPIIAPNNWVLVMAVGNHPLSRIHGASSNLQGSTNSTNRGLTDGGAPFGGLLRLRLEFDSSLRQNLNVKYYRAYYRKGSSGSFTQLASEAHRHYTHVVGGSLVLEPFPLGPHTVNGVPNLFEIPPALPPVGNWSFPDLLEDLTNAKFLTTTLAPAADHGKYEIKIDLFDANGSLVDITALGIKYCVPNVTDLSGTVTTDDASSLSPTLVIDDDGDGKKSFIMTLHIDNNECGANIAAPILGGIPADDDCGVLEYDAASPGSVTMNYTASHPNEFATRHFSVYRGIKLVENESGPVGAGNFSVVDTVHNLLTINSPSGGCIVAGFSENLSVYATAIDGWRRLSEYDQHRVRAFVLAPQVS